METRPADLLFVGAWRCRSAGLSPGLWGPGDSRREPGTFFCSAAACLPQARLTPLFFSPGITYRLQASVNAPIQTERRIGWLTLVLGFAAAAVFAFLRRYQWAIGLGIGTALAWLNFRWLRRGLDSLVAASTAQEGREKPRVPSSSYFAALFRIGLLALSVFLLYNYLHVPLGSMLVGMCALAAAAIAASVWEILRPVK